MLKSEDIKFIRESFKYALDRMNDLPNEIWGSYEEKQKRINEVEEKQKEILENLKNK
ncbi:hypothetical protein HYS72_02430 [Candidatus Pacearchaeota archaeon]|nr:hypothetical protein [Candidatus Pacearchaeota archaeon]MBI2056713.1 hypothetical protein [Candidatus Pacearchaeota archaeon]